MGVVPANQRVIWGAGDDAVVGRTGRLRALTRTFVLSSDLLPVGMSGEKNQDIGEGHRLQELKMKKIRHQIWEHRVRTLSLLLGIAGTLHLSGLL